MPSPDAQATLAYLDFFDLCKVIDGNWELFRNVLIDRDRWRGRLAELREIRNRIAHCRRPHRDDLDRIEQTLRDLEHGAFLAVARYNRRQSAPSDLDDPLVKLWVRRRHEAASRLIEHARRQYDTSFRLEFSRRPWASPRAGDRSVSGTEGYLWHACFFMRSRHLRSPEVLWNDSWLDADAARDFIVHLEIDAPYLVEVAFAAVDDASRIGDAIGHCFDALLTVSDPGPPPRVERDLAKMDRASEAWRAGAAQLDPRVQVHTVWTTLDETTVPVTIFGTGGWTNPGQVKL